nr:immunoglobulin heavy chain junction region [Macaca mulatta]MOX41354.1 immunoglobulin heavy chain junction region [Macaca mulatta]
CARGPGYSGGWWGAFGYFEFW